jgi:hypothetical protein
MILIGLAAVTIATAGAARADNMSDPSGDFSMNRESSREIEVQEGDTPMSVRGEGDGAVYLEVSPSCPMQWMQFRTPSIVAARRGDPRG